MSFIEFNTVEQMIPDAVTKLGGTDPFVLDKDSAGNGKSHGGELRPYCRDYLPVVQVN